MGSSVAQNENSDTLPSATAMQWFAQNSDTEDFEEEENYVKGSKSYKLSPRGKIMIAVYALVVATIVALIAINASVLKSMEQSIVEKEATVRGLIQQSQTLSEELETVKSDAVIAEKAESIGMTKVAD